jgi:tripartite-type tricarboxylate transporter receptor subunit TctC
MIVAAACAPAAFAQATAPWPARPVRIVVPFSPGGFTDVVARILAQQMTASIGGSFIVENKPGAGSTIGTDFVAKSPPDGHTLVIVSSTHVISPWLYNHVPYDPLRSFAPVTKLVDSAYVLLVNPKVPAANVQEFIQLAKAKPNAIRYASSGNGGAQHLIGGLFVSMTGAPLMHIPYRGSGQAAQDLVAGIVESSSTPRSRRSWPRPRRRRRSPTSASRSACRPRRRWPS